MFDCNAQHEVLDCGRYLEHQTRRDDHISVCQDSVLGCGSIRGCNRDGADVIAQFSNVAATVTERPTLQKKNERGPWANKYKHHREREKKRSNQAR